MMLDHIGLHTSYFEQSKSCFTQALAPLGIALVSKAQAWAGFGKAGKPALWFKQA